MARAPKRVLIVEDNRGDIDLVREALQDHGVVCELVALKDGEKALEVIKRIDSGEEPCPDLFVLDLNLPKIDGRKVLEQIRASAKCSQAPVVILSSSDAPEDIEAARKSGASRYIRKPSNLEEFLKIGGVLKQMLEVGAAGI